MKEIVHTVGNSSETFYLMFPPELHPNISIYQLLVKPMLVRSSIIPYEAAIYVGQECLHFRMTGPQ